MRVPVVLHNIIKCKHFHTQLLALADTSSASGSSKSHDSGVPEQPSVTDNPHLNIQRVTGIRGIITVPKTVEVNDTPLDNYEHIELDDLT